MVEGRTDAERIMDLELRIMALEEQIRLLKEETGTTGAYMQAVPEYARKYFEDKKAKLAGGGNK